MLRDLVFAFDCEEGLPESLFDYAWDLIGNVLGKHVGRLFSEYVDATEGRFYLKPGTAEECWKELCEEAKRPEPESD